MRDASLRQIASLRDAQVERCAARHRAIRRIGCVQCAGTAAAASAVVAVRRASCAAADAARRAARLQLRADVIGAARCARRSPLRIAGSTHAEAPHAALESPARSSYTRDRIVHTHRHPLACASMVGRTHRRAGPHPRRSDRPVQSRATFASSRAVSTLADDPGARTARRLFQRNGRAAAPIGPTACRDSGRAHMSRQSAARWRRCRRRSCRA